MKKNKTFYLLGLILLLNFILTLVGIKWGLPNRWCVDEQVANSLKLIASKSIFTVTSIAHPQLYNLFLGVLLLPYLVILKLTGFPIEEAQLAASISWMEMAHAFPNFANNLYLIARFSSVILGVLTVYLLYRIAKIIHNEKVALFSAFTLSVCMGFVATNHLTKHTSLVVFLVLLVLFLCLKSLTEKRHFQRYFYLACFFSGLASTAKLDGIISAFFIAGTINYLLFQEESKISFKERVGLFKPKLILLSVFLFAIGIIIGWPALLLNFDKYLQAKDVGIFYGGFPPLAFSSILKVAEKLKDSIVLMVRNFSLPLSLFIFWGIGNFVKHIKKYPYSLVIGTMLLPYLFISLTYFTQFSGTSTKLIIHAMILFCIFAGKVITDFFSTGNSAKAIFFKKIIIGATFIFAIYYTSQADLFFCYRDTRYYSTSWIIKNVPTHKTIEHYQEGENIFSTADIPFRYDVIYYGRHSKDCRGKESFYRLNSDEEKNKYQKELNLHGSAADFFILALGGEFVTDVRHLAPGSFPYNLYYGKENNFRLAKIFLPNDNFFFKPRPEWAAPQIFIYERVH